MSDITENESELLLKAVDSALSSEIKEHRMWGVELYYRVRAYILGEPMPESSLLEVIKRGPGRPPKGGANG